MKKLVGILLILGIGFTQLSAVNSEDVSSVGFNDLSDQDKADILKEIAMRKANTEQAAQTTTVDEAQKWVDLGASIGKGLASSAKELGIAVNDFAKTEVGQLTMWLIVFNLLGDTIIHLVAGTLFIILGVTFTTILMNRKNPYTYSYDSNTGKLVSKKRSNLEGDSLVSFWIAYALFICVGIIIMVTGG